MANARSRIQLTEEEQFALLEDSLILQVANIDGRTPLFPMWFATDDASILAAITSYGSSQKTRNLERDSRICVLADTGTAYTGVRGHTIDGEAEIVRDPYATARVLQLVGARHGDRPRPQSASEVEPPPAANMRVTVRIQPRRARSSDHRKPG